MLRASSRPRSTAWSPALAAAGRFDEAIPHARRRLALDPLDEPAHRRLIELLRRRRAARRGAAAVPRVRARARPRARRAAAARDDRAVPGGQRGAAGGGRAGDRRCRARCRRGCSSGATASGRSSPASYAACARDGRIVALEGEAGIGKTRLGEEHVAHARSLGAVAVDRAPARGRGGAAVRPDRRHAARGARRARRRRPARARCPHCRAEAARLVPELADGRAAAARGRAGRAPALLRGARADARRARSPARARRALRSTTCTGPTRRRSTCWRTSRAASPARPLQIVAAWRPPSSRVRARRRLRSGRRGSGSSSSVSAAPTSRELAEAAGAPGVADRLFRDSEGLPLFVVEYLAAHARAARMPRVCRAACARCCSRVSPRCRRGREPAARGGRGDRAHVRRRRRCARRAAAARTRPSPGSRSSAPAG